MEPVYGSELGLLWSRWVQLGGHCLRRLHGDLAVQGRGG